MTASPLLYNQSTLNDDDFVANFVARGDTLETLLRRLRAIDPDASGTHQILIGTRGMGKSSLLRRLAIAITRDEHLASLYIPLTFREEQYNVLALGDFWRNCGEALAEWAETRGLPDLAARLDIALTTKTWAGDDTAAEQFDRELLQLQRRAVLLVDNLDLILDALKEDDQWSLRRHLQARRGPVMIGAATRTLTQSADRNAAFYEFFHPHHLEPLNQQETEQCMRALAQRRGAHGVPVTHVLNTQPERLKTLHALTGGNPRVLTLIYRLLEAAETSGAMADLDILLDQVTPYYKARIEEYQTSQQRAVIDAIALNWDPITVGTLSQVTNIPTTTLSPLLIKLRKDGLIEATEVSSASTGHQITERFLNIWYLMRHGTRRTKHKLRWLVRFLTVFYTSDELHDISRKISAPEAEINCHSDYKLALDAALRLSVFGKDVDTDLSVGKSAGLAHFPQRQSQIDPMEGSNDFVELDHSDEAKIARELIERSINLFECGNYLDALAICDEIITSFGDTSELALLKQVASALVLKGWTLERSGDHMAAITIFDDVITRHSNTSELALQQQVASALVLKGWTLERSGDHMAAITILDDVITRYSNTSEPALQQQVASTLVFKGIILGQKGDHVAAIAALDDIITRFSNTIELELQRQVASALVIKGMILEQKGDSMAAIAALGDTITRFSNATEPELLKQVVSAIDIKVELLEQESDPVSAIAAYDDVIALLKNSHEVELHAKLALVQIHKGKTLAQMEKWIEAIAIYENIIARFGEAAELALQEMVALALIEKGATLGKIGDLEAQIAAYNDVEARFGEAAELTLQEMVAHAQVGKGFTFHNMGDTAAAIAIHDDFVTRFGNTTEPSLQELVAWALLLKGNTFNQIGDHAAAIAVYDDVVARLSSAIESDRQEPFAQALKRKGATLQQMGDHVEAIAAFNDVIARFCNATEPALQTVVASARIALGNLLLDLESDPTRATELFQAAITDASHWANGNLVWAYLLDDKIAAGRALLDDLHELPSSGRSLLGAAFAICEDNFGLASEALHSVLTKGLDDGGLNFEDDLYRLIRLMERKGYGERLITWFDDSGFADQMAPLYVALKAYIRGEAVLLDVNPEVRSAARNIYDRLDAPRRYRRQTMPEPVKPKSKRGRPRKS